jgi:glycerol-3-phosphate acyltransferase PlsY
MASMILAHPWQMVAAAVIAYLLGSINSSIIVSKLLLGVDVRKYGSGNAGLTNSFRTMGAKKTVFVLIGDVLKGMVSVWIGGFIGGQTGAILAAGFAVLGHVFPIYFGFKGGKGILTGASVLLAFDWRVFAVCIGTFFVLSILTHYVSLGSIVAAGIQPFVMHHFHPDPLCVTVAACAGILMIYKHKGNIVRLCKGEESKFSFHSKPQLDKEGKK